MNDKAVWKSIEREYQREMDKIAIRCKELFRQAILENVYFYYNPKVYEPTDQLLNATSIKFDNNGDLLVYSDPNLMHYTSVVTGEDVSEYVPFWIQEGHDDGIGVQEKGYNQYHRYEGRHYLEKAVELIKKEYPFLKIKIINEDPF